MDGEADATRSEYEKVTTQDVEAEEGEFGLIDAQELDAPSDGEAEEDEIPSTISTSEHVSGILHRTLLSDHGVSIRDHPLVEGDFTVKLLKFILLTFASISLVHVIVKKRISDRDKSLTISDIWRFEGNLIVMDCVVFFLVGRMWRQRGVDHLAWLIPMLICNIYFESQSSLPWLQHSVTLYEIHCLWPWQLWVFVLVLVPSIGGVVLAHVVRAYRKRLLLMKLVELSFCAFFFLSPVTQSRYFHLHHWFAGWLLGMHCNFDVWWSRAAMAYCWGMYINGIAVYGRDPVLTCEYAYFLSVDNRCPYVQCYLDALEEQAEHPHHGSNHTVHEMVPVDWRNCSASGYHP